MLDAGSYGIPREDSGFPEVLSLVTLNHRLCVLAVQVRILARGLHDPAPPGIPYRIKHRGEGDVKAAGCRFSRRGLLHSLRIKHRPLGQRDREDRVAAVDDVHHEQQRNVMRVILHIFPLYPAQLRGTAAAERRTGKRDLLTGQADLPHRAGKYGISVLEETEGQLLQLSRFFFETHFT